MAKPKPQQKIVDALMALAAERPWEEVTLDAIAERAGVTLAALRAAYDGRLAVLADFVRRVDERVLAGVDPDAGEGGAARAALRCALQPPRGARAAQAGDPQSRRRRAAIRFSRWS